ncbi:type II secretion system protein N [Pseudomonas sp. WS 5111]|jgi:general secretion pathway protein N|uniref:type II secretion system protein N n=1 Tax=unclassified Pseudomonas TaxID=196821 RepID=UPI001473CAE4|nr:MULTISPECIES: type II secretion system protein N [unclassified Pseudomonas]NMX66956.1 type II secretion system protein N [Pseudomonas sp. WS 5111]NMX85020.1 type II secretion system protein N [Pseudomonas sp. WS 5010]
MSRAVILWAIVVFSLTVLLELPAAFVARQLPWPTGWQPSGVVGSLWTGRAARVGALAPVDWNIRPWAAQVNLRFAQRIWELSIHGWPWNWQAQLAPRAVSALPPPMFVLDGRWDGRLQVNGAGAGCRNTDGELLGHDLALLSPWLVKLGNTRIELQCRDGLRLLADLQLAAEHHFKIQVDSQRVQVDGQIEPGAAVTPLLVQARWLQPAAQSFSKVLGKPLVQ